MSVLSDSEIRKLCQDPDPMITPFSEGIYREGVISYGLSSSGYDVRLGGKIKVFKNTCCVPVNPKRFKTDKAYENMIFDEFTYNTGEEIVIPPHGYILGVTCETFNLPVSVVGIATGKSTYARCGIAVNVTPLEPGWRGQLVVEIANHNPSPAVVFAYEGIAQIVFHLIHGVVEKGYADKYAGGQAKYQDQTGITLARV